MCGIAGYFSPIQPVEFDGPGVLGNMGKVLEHRGPDDSGLWSDEVCGLSFRRLSIIDLPLGKQPMSTSDGRYHLVFNGEIYNFKDLRLQLQQKGARFHTDSDSEVILLGYTYWGEGIVSRLRGMFAFAIYDKAEKVLFAARDHTGIKPFYYYFNDGHFVFASEAKALFQHPKIKASFDESALPAYLSFLWVPQPKTFFLGIKVLKPGHFLTITTDDVNEERYWSPDLRDFDLDKSEAQWMEQIDFGLARSTKEQMMSDVPLGAFLSGGVDSSLIVNYMNQASSHPVTTYTTGFSKADLVQDVIRSDLEYARLAADHLNVSSNELVLEPDVATLIPRLTWHMDEPVSDPAAITTYLVCKACKEKATVMLSGVGGDEIFGGYPRYLANQAAERYEKIPRWIRRQLIESVAALLPSGSNRLLRDIRKFVKSAGAPFPQRYFGFLTYYDVAELNELLNSEFKAEHIFDFHNQILGAFPGSSPLQSAMNLDLMTFLPQLNLAYTDKMSMAASVEVRVPFLDHRLIEDSSKLPERLRICRGQGKFALKKVAEKYLPRNLVWRKKAGFGAPVGAWLKTQLKEMMLDLLSAERIKRRGYLDSKFVGKLIADHLSGRSYNANQLWQLVTLEIWMQEFID